MALLTTAPYDAARSTAWVGDIIKIASQMEESRARVEEARRGREQQQVQQTLADQRRAFEFDRRLEFERAKTTADDVRADSRLDIERQDHALNRRDRAPFSLDPATPSSSVPVLSAGGGDKAAGGALLPPPAWSEPDLPTKDSAATAITSGAMAGSISGSTSIPGIGALPSAIAGAQEGEAAPPASKNSSEAEKQDGLKVSMIPLVTEKTPSQQIGEMASELAKTRLFTNKQAQTILQQGAAAIAARKPESAEKPIVRNMADGTTQQYSRATSSWSVIARKPEGATLAQSLEDVTAGMDHDAGRNTYIAKDGGEFFPYQTAKGWVLRPFKPAAEKPAKMLWGDDGQVYAFDQKGEPLKPVPEGVQLRDHSKLQVVKVDGVGEVSVNPDGTTTTLIPQGMSMTSKQKDSYIADVGAVQAAKAELDVQNKLMAENPSKIGVSWFGGGTHAAVKAAEDKLYAASEKAAEWHREFPQLRQKPNVALPAAAPGSKVFEDEGAARAAGAKSGDVILLRHPQTGKPARFQLK